MTVKVGDVLVAKTKIRRMDGRCEIKPGEAVTVAAVYTSRDDWHNVRVEGTGGVAMDVDWLPDSSPWK